MKLYRHFDKCGSLLYIGTSLNVFARTRGHLGVSEWREEIATVTIETFETAKAGRLAEKVAIQDEKPIHNTKSRNKECDKGYACKGWGIWGYCGLFGFDGWYPDFSQAEEMVNYYRSFFRSVCLIHRCEFSDVERFQKLPLLNELLSPIDELPMKYCGKRWGTKRRSSKKIVLLLRRYNKKRLIEKFRTRAQPSVGSQTHG